MVKQHTLIKAFIQPQSGSVEGLLVLRGESKLETILTRENYSLTGLPATCCFLGMTAYKPF